MATVCWRLPGRGLCAADGEEGRGGGAVVSGCPDAVVDRTSGLVLHKAQ